MINDYLTEKLLKVFLYERINTEIIANKKLSEYNFKPDYYLPEYKTIIEFDGYWHYNSARQSLRDIHVTTDLKNLGYNVLRIPYFVQLDSRVISKLFNKESKICLNNYSSFNDYKHGFIDAKALLPADFNEIGINRFNYDLCTYSMIAQDIINSIHDKIAKTGNCYRVIPAQFDIISNAKCNGNIILRQTLTTNNVTFLKANVIDFYIINKPDMLIENIAGYTSIFDYRNVYISGNDIHEYLKACRALDIEVIICNTSLDSEFMHKHN